MARANLVLPNGTKVDIQGTAEEVASLLRAFSAHKDSTPGQDRTPPRSPKRNASGPRRGPTGLTGLIRGLRDDGFFAAKRTLGDIQRELEHRGRIYKQPPISATLLHLVRRKELQRMKDRKGYMYVT